MRCLTLSGFYVLTRMATAIKPLRGLFFNSQKCCHTLIKSQKMSGGALRRHSSFGFDVLSKTYFAI